MTHTVWVLGHDSFIDTYTGIMIYISGFCKTDHRVYKDVLRINNECLNREQEI